MLKNYVKIAIRNLWKHKTFAGINILGLALGLAMCWLLVQYVRFEQSYDQFMGDKPIYRVETMFSKGGKQKEHWATTSNGYAPAMKANFPEIENYTRIFWRGSERVVRYENQKFREPHVCLVDSNFFTFFDYPVLLGDRRTFLNEPNTVVLSESAARKYFGSQNPVGKTLEISTLAKTLNCQVTGVFADLPANSTMQFSMLISGKTATSKFWNFWYQHANYTFVQLKPNADPGRVEAKFPALAEQYKTEEAMKDDTWGIKLVLLRDIHLNPATPNEIEIKGNRKAVQFLSIIAFVILLISWVNYSNLTTARAMYRAKEAGVRRMVGSSKRLLLLQFVVESTLVHALALLVASGFVLVATLLLPDSLHLNSVSLIWIEPLTFVGFLALWLLGIVLTGVYPATVLLRASPASVLKGKFQLSVTERPLRQSLVVVQFTISVILLISTLVVYRQTAYMTSQKAGVLTDQVVVLKAPVNTADYGPKTEQLKRQLASLAGVLAVTSSGAVPGKEVGQFLANRRFEARAADNRLYEMLQVDHEFIQTYGLQLVAGRGFDRNRPADSTALVINESAVKQLGFTSSEQALGQRIALEVTPGHPNEIIGVIRDYHQRSLHHPFTPVMLFMDPAYKWIPTDFFSVKIHTADPQPLLKNVETIWNQLFPESSLDYFFLDEFYNQQYQQDRQYGILFSIFSSLAIFIACLGLFGLATFSAQQRTKEIGVRKVVGASVFSIVALLSKDFLKLVFIAIVVASPLAWYVMTQWLNDFAYKIDLSWWIFALAGLLAIAIALITVSFQSVKAALMNPVKSLRSD
ncbi:ABC transporter permease [Spirosoma terrae]|uniref:FtsX-like permease family protein n=1 Tax=Spirosoma terrae TaxID=1968276 RepID=A0A6L9LAW2_9BACT|nr:ABC transporter permease [Spirosoma terrae]NDU97656.1 FtsX-like permease family protein [Spirosoma terrae]